MDAPTGGPSVGIGTNPGSTPGTTIGSNTYIQNADGANQMCSLLTPGNNVAVEWHTSGTLVDGTFKFHLITFTVTQGSNDQVNWTNCNVQVQDTPYLVTVAKSPCNVTSVDSRLAYGDGDTPPADANTSPRPINFSGNLYKGGAFVGNMGPGNSQSDRSGTARVLIYPGTLPTQTTPYAMVIASLLHTGDPIYADADLLVGAYCPTTTHTYLLPAAGAPTISTVVWANQWESIHPTPTWIPNSGSYSTIPISLTTLLGTQSTATGSAIGDYASFPLTAVYDNPNYNAQGVITSYSTVAAIPATFSQGICIASANELAYQANGTSIFHWLMSQNYPTAGLAYPYNDAQPRLWIVTGTGLN